MRIAGLSARPPQARDVAEALTGATGLLGQRPAITEVGAWGRREQGFVSLAGWVAKGANLLTVELDIGAGDRVAVGGPFGWPLAAVTLAAWWVGATVVPVAAATGARLQVIHTACVPLEHSGEVLWFGDAIDGTGDPTLVHGEQWTDAVTPHADRPPRAAHDGDLVAFVDLAGQESTQRMLLDPLNDDPGGVLGVWRDDVADGLALAEAARLLTAVALRPLVTGAATVLLTKGDPQADAHAAAERVVRWSTEGR